MEFYVIFLIGFGLICAIVSHCVRVGKDHNAKSNNTDNTSEKEKADMAYNKAIWRLNAAAPYRRALLTNKYF